MPSDAIIVALDAFEDLGSGFCPAVKAEEALDHGVVPTICAHPHADFKNPLPLGSIKPRKFRYVRLQFLTLPGVELVSLSI